MQLIYWREVTHNLRRRKKNETECIVILYIVCFIRAIYMEH